MLKWIREWAERWYPVFAAFYYLGVGVSTLILAATVIVNFVNRVPSKSDTNYVAPFGSLLSANTYVFLLDYRWSIISISGLLVASFGWVVWRRYRRRLSIGTCLDNVALEYSEFLRDLRAYTLQSIDHGRMSKEAYDRYIGDICADIDAFLISSANRISVLFEEYTGRKCHVSLKFFDPQKREIRTVARDEVSLRNRASIDEKLNWYPFTANTAFNEILTDESQSAFVCNHLRLRSLRGEYKNLNPHWNKLYSACMVAPITLNTHSAQINPQTVLGFLCVDNRGGKFDRNLALSILQSFARMYHFVLAASASLQAIDNI